MSPLVSIIVPIYNGESYMYDAISSVLNQTYKNIEVVVVLDGCTDGTEGIMQKYFSHDARVKVISRENKGLIYTLNEALSLSSGKFIARMDADDTMHIDRIRLQVEFLLKRPKVAFVGSSIRRMSPHGKLGWPRFVFGSDKWIRSSFYFGNPFCHPTVMFNTQVIDRLDLNYSESFKYVEDLELFYRLVLKGYKVANLRKMLLNYRLTPEGVSRKFLTEQKAAASTVYANDPLLSSCKVKIENLYNQECFSIDFFKGVVQLNVQNLKLRYLPVFPLICVSIITSLKLILKPTLAK